MNLANTALKLSACTAVLAAGGCYWLIGGEEHRRKQEIAEHTKMAEIHELAANYEGAADEYRAVIELAPQLAEAYMGLGNNLNRLSRYDEAAEAYRKAVELEPKVYGFRFNLGVTLARAEKYEEAAAELKVAATLEPEKAEPFVYLGSALRSAGDYESAAAALARALVNEPGNTLARLNLALTLEDLDPARAAHEWRKVRDAPDALPAWREMAEERLADLTREK
ncbi:MAG: tetratricopeptide repeat protein [candidate division Zixibacteria bacterium]|nr:tetratricopeptide repeat protein [candidate division Zixibacteria bacterium]